MFLYKIKLWNDQVKINKQLTMTFVNDGGTFKPSGIITEPKFSFSSSSQIEIQSTSNIFMSPGNSKVIVSSE